MYRLSCGLYNYGNWSAEILERSCMLNKRYGSGSQTSLTLADLIDDKMDNYNNIFLMNFNIISK